MEAVVSDVVAPEDLLVCIQPKKGGIAQPIPKHGSLLQVNSINPLNPEKIHSKED